MHPRRLRRLSGFSYLGRYRYSLTLCAFQRRAQFTRRDVVDTAVAQFLQAGTTCRFAIIAYCFMPDHVHVLAEGRDERASLGAFAKRAKQLSGYHCRRLTLQRIWQPGYYERVIREDEDMRVVVAYILDNPVRAGLVETPADHPFSGSGEFSFADLLTWASNRSHVAAP